MTIIQPRLLPDTPAPDETPAIIAAAIEYYQAIVSGRKVGAGRRAWAAARLKELRKGDKQ